MFTNNPINKDYGLRKSSTILVSGGSRSGKSKWAEYLIRDHPKVCYIATGVNDKQDEDWQKRIKIHRDRRPNHWRVIESSKNLANIIEKNNTNSILIESLGGFVASNIHINQWDWEIQLKGLVKVLRHSPNTIVIVIEQTGWSVVPETEIGNKFRDRLGSLSLELEMIAKSSWLVIQGRAINLRDISVPIP